MSDNSSLVSGINEWLADQALSEPDIVGMFEGLCHRLHAIGIPLARARLIWPTLHPLFQAETILWNRDRGTEFEQFQHEENLSNAWLASPMKHMLEHELTVLRRHLDGSNKLVDFPVIKDAMELGMTDYLVVSTPFSSNSRNPHSKRRGIFVTWNADREGGFSDSEVESLQKIQRRFAVACKTVLQARISHNIVDTYLGKQAGEQVLSGAIRHGDGSNIKAVVWYSDMRNSTALADTMPGDEYIKLINTYFQSTAGPVIEAGGEVLDFIGDAVLAIFPFDTEDEKSSAICAATSALQASVVAGEKVSQQRRKDKLPVIDFGIGLNMGQVLFGNIGVPERLSFSVIGPTINEAARIEKMTKIIGKSTLVTKDIAACQPTVWDALGEYTLHGVSQKVELYTLADSNIPKSLSTAQSKTNPAEKPAPSNIN